MVVVWAESKLKPRKKDQKKESITRKKVNKSGKSVKEINKIKRSS